MKSVSDIMTEVLESPDMKRKLKETLELMNNVNPSGLCMFCGIHCGKGHMICLDCYGKQKLMED